MVVVKAEFAAAYADVFERRVLVEPMLKPYLRAEQQRTRTDCGTVLALPTRSECDVRGAVADSR